MLLQMKGFLVGVTNYEIKKEEYDVRVELGVIRGMPVQKLKVTDQS